VNRDYYVQMYRLEDEHWWFVARRNLICRTLSRWLPTGKAWRLLDVGGTLDRLQASFGKPVGVDLEPLALDLCRERGHENLALASATRLPFPDGAFEGIVALDVLEHIPDDEAAAKEIARVLSPDGVLVVTVPAYQSLWSQHDVALMHQRRYRAHEVRRILEAADLKVERLSYTVSLLFPAVWVVRKLQNLRPKKSGEPVADAKPTAPWLNKLLRSLLDAESSIALNRSLPFGLSVYAVATKRGWRDREVGGEMDRR
jgi:SAM-dependent methyltransferase